MLQAIGAGHHNSESINSPTSVANLYSYMALANSRKTMPSATKIILNFESPSKWQTNKQPAQ